MSRQRNIGNLLRLLCYEYPCVPARLKFVASSLAGSLRDLGGAALLKLKAALACDCFLRAARKASYFKSGILSTIFAGQIFAMHSFKCFRLIPNSPSLLTAAEDKVSSDKKHWISRQSSSPGLAGGTGS